MKPILVLFFACLCAISSARISCAQTVVVGKCRAGLVSYPTISAAVAAVSPNTTVDVCPGTYPETVMITTPLTLKGLTTITGTRMVFVQGITVQGTGPVDIDNVVVGATGATGGGIVYATASGTVEDVDVRSGGIVARGEGVNAGSTLTVKDSSISGGGVYASGTVSAGSILNLTSDWITSIGNSGTAVDYENGANGLIERNTIILAGGTTTGILLDYFGGNVTANDNTIIGANVGINLPTSEVPTIVTHNQLYNNGTAILVTQRGGGAVIKSNSIVLSSVAAINFSICNNGNANTVEHNTIVDAPVGIENISSGDIVAGNPIYNVTTATTPCTD
jgi:hypothetical protein